MVKWILLLSGSWNFYTDKLFAFCALQKQNTIDICLPFKHVYICRISANIVWYIMKDGEDKLRAKTISEQPRG